jgi:hypothetical protein
MKQLNFLIIVVCGIVVFLGGCSRQSSIKITAKYSDFVIDSSCVDANIPVLVEAHGDAAKPIAEMVANNAKTKEARRNELVQSLVPMYIILFGLGLAGIVLIVVMQAMKMPSKWTWIIPTVSFGGMGIIHFFSEFAKPIPYVVLVLVIAFFIWKILQYKKERNVNRAMHDTIDKKYHETLNKLRG